MQTITLPYHIQDGDNIMKKELTISPSLLREPYSKESLFVIQIKGNSMEPKIQDDALVIADLSQRLTNHGDTFIVEYDKKLWIKEVKIEDDRCYFVSINPDYADLIYSADDVRVVAKALLSFTQL